MLKHVAKIDKNIKTHFTSSNKYSLIPQHFDLTLFIST